MRLIDADALLKPTGCYNPVKYTYEYGFVVTVDDIKAAETKAERQKGKWIRITNSTAPTQMWNCSECGRTVEKNTVLDPDIFFPFCHCGADMREVDNEVD